MNKTLILLLLILFSNLTITQAQKRVEKGVIYQSGDQVYGPVAGISSVIPSMWMGINPQGSESFLLIPSDNSNAQIIVLIVKDSIDAIKNRWKNKMEFTNNIYLELEKPPVERNGWLTGDIKVTGSTGHNKGYVEAKCGNWGVCTINLLVADEGNIEKYKPSLISFSDSCVFTEPTLASRYGDFDWTTFLQNKALIRWSHDPDFRQNNQVHLCKSGTFQSKLKTKGIIKDDKSPYFGKNSGTWEVQGIGPTAKLYLYFNKLTPLIVEVEMRDGGKLFVNGIQYFSIESNKCTD